jgi:exonuclease III
MNGMDTSQWIMFKPCTFKDSTNLNFSVDIKKLATNEITHYPVKMMQCNGLEDDLLGTLLPQSTRSGIFLIKKKNTTEPTINVTDIKVHDEKVFAHVPMTCKVDNLIITTWNVEGRCYSNYSKSQREQRKIRMVQFLKKVNPDIFCVQNYYLRKQVQNGNSIGSDLSDFLIKERYGRPTHKVFYDGYSDAMVVRNELISKTLSLPLLVPRYNDVNKQNMILYIDHTTPFYMVNVHLSTVKKPISTHQMEVNNLLTELTKEELFLQGIPSLWMGTFNQKNAEELFIKAERRRYNRSTRALRGGARTFRKYHKM